MPPYTTTQQLPLSDEYTPEDTLNYSLIRQVFVGNYNTVDTIPAVPSLDSGVPLEVLETRTVYITGVVTTPGFDGASHASAGVYTLGYNADLGLLSTEGNVLNTVSNDDYEPGINHR